ncbi:MAG: GIY-YIG nuclease family protein [Candidatus Moranbacteria bacterium]|nr:GIY-YIG nuclease family protein [Candidatus Moranbacteria bacterium]
MYTVYILRCADETLYTGITTDIVRRVGEHNHSALGARYTRGRRPVDLVYERSFENRAVASREEARIKKLSRNEKQALIDEKKNTL